MIHSLYMRRKAGFELMNKIRPGNPQLLHNVTIGLLEKLGMDRVEALRWRLLSRLDNESFDHLVRTASSLTYNHII